MDKKRGVVFCAPCGSRGENEFLWLAKENSSRRKRISGYASLEENPLCQRERLPVEGISNGAAYYCITALVDKGL